MRGGGQPADGLHHAGLVVGCHNAHERHIVAEQLDKRGRLNVARTAGLHQVDGKARGTQQRQVVQDRIVLDGRYDHAVALAVVLTGALGKSEERQLVCLGAAIGQDNLGRADARAKAAGDLATRHFQARSGLAAERMQRVGVDAGKLAVVIFALRKERLGAHGRRGGIVKIHGYAVLTCGHKGLCLLYGLVAQLLQQRNLGGGIFGLKYGGTGHQHVGAGLDDLGDVFGRNAPVDLDHGRHAVTLAHGLELVELMQSARDKTLAAKAGVHTHQQHHIDDVDDALEHADGRCGVEHHAGLDAALLQVRERAVQVCRGLVVNGDHIGTGVGVPIDRLVGVRHHEVCVDRHVGGALDSLEDVNAKGEVAGKVAIHDIEVHKVGTGDLVELALEVGHVGRKDGRSDFNGTHGSSLSALIGESVELLRWDAVGENLERPIQSNTVVERLLHGKGERNVYAQ